MTNYELSHIKGDHTWKWLLVVGAALITISIYQGGKLHDIQDTRFKLDGHSAFWGLCVLLLSILVFVDLVGLDQHLDDTIGSLILIQLILGVAWAYFDYKDDTGGLLLTQVLLLISVGYLVYLFYHVSRFGFWISVIYLISVVYATWVLLEER